VPRINRCLSSHNGSVLLLSFDFVNRFFCSTVKNSDSKLDESDNEVGGPTIVFGPPFPPFSRWPRARPTTPPNPLPLGLESLSINNGTDLNDPFEQATEIAVRSAPVSPTKSRGRCVAWVVFHGRKTGVFHTWYVVILAVLMY
jgi:hypothetical protein